MILLIWCPGSLTDVIRPIHYSAAIRFCNSTGTKERESPHSERFGNFKSSLTGVFDPKTTNSCDRHSDLCDDAFTVIGCNGTTHCCTLDVTQLEDVKAFVEFAVSTHGRIDVVVNNAGAMPLFTT